MKKRYQEAELEIIAFDAEDVIITSGCPVECVNECPRETEILR